MTCNLPDYHTHTTLCNHAEGTMEAYVESAIARGLTEMGFADHMPVMPEPHLCMRYDQLPRYVDSVLELRERYRDRISIKLGCEMDIVADRLDEIREIIAGYPFDYVIGSVHYLDGWPFDQKQYSDEFGRRDLGDIYRAFFDAIIAATQTGVHDIVGHIDNIKRMGYVPGIDLTPEYERVAAAVRDAGLAVEINTSGFDHPVAESYPSMAFLKVLNRYDVPITCGSDSHAPGDLGRHFDCACAMLREAGYDRVMEFTGRKRLPRMLSSACPEQPSPESRV